VGIDPGADRVFRIGEQQAESERRSGGQLRDELLATARANVAQHGSSRLGIEIADQAGGGLVVKLFQASRRRRRQHMSQHRCPQAHRQQFEKCGRVFDRQMFQHPPRIGRVGFGKRQRQLTRSGHDGLP
jgi:hypothetical protein